MPRGVIFSVTYADVALGRIPGLRLDRVGIAMTGAALMMATGAIIAAEPHLHDRGGGAVSCGPIGQALSSSEDVCANNKISQPIYNWAKSTHTQFSTLAFQLKNVKGYPVLNVKVVFPYIIQHCLKFLVEFFNFFTR